MKSAATGRCFYTPRHAAAALLTSNLLQAPNNKVTVFTPRRPSPLPSLTLSEQRAGAQIYGWSATGAGREGGVASPRKEHRPRSCPLSADWVSADMTDAKCLEPAVGTGRRGPGWTLDRSCRRRRRPLHQVLTELLSSCSVGSSLKGFGCHSNTVLFARPCFCLLSLFFFSFGKAESKTVSMSEGMRK